MLPSDPGQIQISWNPGADHQHQQQNPGLSILRPAVKILCWVCAAVTVISGLTYFSGSGDLFSDMK